MQDATITPAAEAESPSRAALLEAALALFLEHGFAATRVEDIAVRAGISKGAVYLHFATKAELLRAVVQGGVVVRLEQAELFAAGFDGSASELLAMMLRNNLLEFWGSPSSGIMKLVIAESQQFPGLAEEYHTAITSRARELLSRVLQQGIEQGEYRELDVEYTARFILNALDHEIVWAHSLSTAVRADFNPQRYIDVVLETIRAGVGIRSDS